MNKVLQNGENFHFKVTKNKSITAANLISLMKDSDHIKMALTLSYLQKKTDLTEQKEAFVKRNNASYALFGFPWAFLVLIYEAFPHLERYAGKSLDSPLPIPHLLRWHRSKYDNIMKGDPFKYKRNNTKIVHPYLTLTVREMEQRYMKTYKQYTDKVKDTSIDALKMYLKGVTVLTSSAEVAAEDENLGGHHYVPSPPRACDHAGSSGLKTSPDASNYDDLRERVTLLEKSLLNIASFVREERLRRIEKNKKKQQKQVHLDRPPLSRHQVNLEELAVAVTDIAAADEKGEEEKKEEATEENNTTDEEEEVKDEEMTDEKKVEEELVVEQEVENIGEEKKSVEEEEEKENKKKEVEEEEKKQEEKEVDVMGIVAELNQEN
ncbi:glutamic acid-rich protein-like [Capsicum galapagoense]